MEPPLFKGRRFALWREGREDPLRSGEQAWAGEDLLVDLQTGGEADPAEVARYISELEEQITTEESGSVSGAAFEFQGCRYTFVMASDRVRDGMGLELSRVMDNDFPGDNLLEIFYSDQDGSFTVDLYESLPLELVECSIAVAKRSLPPVAGK